MKWNKPDWDFPDDTKPSGIGHVTTIDYEEGYVPPKKKVPFGFQAPKESNRAKKRKRSAKNRQNKRN